MGAKSAIGWTDASWNFVRGCRRVSEGCDHCYAIGVAHRFDTDRGSQTFKGLTRSAGGRVDWMGHARFYPEHLALPLQWREPRRIFVNSLSDLFHESLAEDQIAQGYAVMALAARHQYQILTKRPARMRALLATGSFPDLVLAHAERIRRARRLPFEPLPPWPMPHVWHGVSVETQRWADRRIPDLLATPSAVRFLSCEPLLGPIDLSASLHDREGRPRPLFGPDWVIVGGESGPGARTMQAAWATSLLDQCAAAGVPCYFKQAGTGLARELGLPGKGEELDGLPPAWRVRQYPRPAPEDAAQAASPGGR